jgi:hypothetical protein
MLMRRIPPGLTTASELFGGLEETRYGVMRELSSHIARRLKDEAEIEKQRSKVRELKGADNKLPKRGGKGDKGRGGGATKSAPAKT